MSDEPTLEAFAGDGDDEKSGEGASDDSGTGGDRADVAEAAETGARSALAVTSAYQPDGECASCGASSTRLWADGDGGRVCSNCTVWTTTGGRAADQ
ncbi:DUF7573 domain-containing protein [Halobacterium rubrum]|uniref:DUF7573 domain-containing protein n=1 Tax=Halobacterium TaxID=2239 RepID=UPI001F3D95E8|nr:MULTISPECIES: hypothetical protein [Halobacterium]MDH5020489.1 hypothetical protein [Halobacterium rubrum]